MLSRAITIISLVFIVSSCVDITEELKFNKDGSGTYSIIIIDELEFTRNFASKMMLNMAKIMDSTGTFENPTEEQMDSLMALIDTEVWGDYPDVIDSTSTLASYMDDSTLNFGNNRYYAERAKFFMRGSRESGHRYMGTEYAFKDFKDLNGYFEFMTNTNLGNEGESEVVKMTSSLFSEAPKQTIRMEKGRIIKEVSDESLEKENEEMAEFIEMMGENYYIMKIVAPTDIKEIKSTGEVTVDGKKAAIKVSFRDLLSGNAGTGYEIILK